jgi:hypothetical protein
VSAADGFFRASAMFTDLMDVGRYVLTAFLILFFSGSDIPASSLSSSSPVFSVIVFLPVDMNFS